MLETRIPSIKRVPAFATKIGSLAVPPIMTMLSLKWTTSEFMANLENWLSFLPRTQSVHIPRRLPCEWSRSSLGLWHSWHCRSSNFCQPVQFASLWWPIYAFFERKMDIFWLVYFFGCYFEEICPVLPFSAVVLIEHPTLSSLPRRRFIASLS